ncbi:M28 family metallopeptidase [Roseomonas haemaphysalidis]|uniref:M28 family peptidase n=1 Tax=Roseomonas haemaphysalidis TaxID=2768162 RepID=A0ABS3KRA1_9PROT|nr:M28 family peptidase [Roseomonas haemaphysalidis]MBO1078846.1 M28 family peptidase [Roseomonas haemaphysalidis]
MTAEAREFAAAVQAAEMMSNLSTMARWRKLTGTPEEGESIRFIQQRMDAYGFRTELLMHDAYVSLPGPAHVTVDGQRLQAITHSMSLSSPPDGLSGRLVDLGAGDEAAFARDADLRGAILLLDGIASPAAASRAARVGAAGTLHVSPHEHLHEMCISPVWGSPGAETAAQMPATVACTISQADGQALRARLAAGDAPAVVLHATVDTGWRPIPLLVAELDAPDATAPFILFSGHHDTWFEGVMDNGAANATMMEVARLAATRRAEWKRGLRFCFWSGHSQGRYAGSTWYADTHWAELDARCAVHVNVDSTGGQGATVMTEAPSDGALVGFATQVLRDELGVQHEGKRNGRNGDASFWGIGLPSLFSTLSHQPPSTVAMRNPLGWWWHTPHDLLEQIDPDFLARDTKVYAHAVWRLLTEPQLPLDPAATAASLLAELQRCETPMLPLDALADEVAALQERLERGALEDAEAMRVCRALVPLDFTSGDRFAHDPALPQPAWPVLEPLRALARAEEGSEAAHRLVVSARRTTNRVRHAVRQAMLALA